MTISKTKPKSATAAETAVGAVAKAKPTKSVKRKKVAPKSANPNPRGRPKKTGPVKPKLDTRKIIGDRLNIDTSFAGYPSLVNREGHITVTGIGPVRGWVSDRDWAAATKHRTKFMLIGKSLAVVPMEVLTLTELAERAGVELKDSGDFHKNTKFSVNSPEGMRWATAEESANYVKSEMDLRRAYFDRAYSAVQRKLKRAQTTVTEAAAAQVKAEAQAAELSEKLVNIQVKLPRLVEVAVPRRK